VNINSRLSRLLFVIKVYSDSLYITMDFLSNKAFYISNLLYIEGTFNIKDAKWNPFASSYSIASQILSNLVDSYSFIYLIPVLSILTHYLDIEPDFR